MVPACMVVLLVIAWCLGWLVVRGACWGLVGVVALFTPFGTCVF